MSNYLSQTVVGPPPPPASHGPERASDTGGGGGDVSTPVQPCPRRDPPEPPPIKVRISLFFDGTGNNRTNVGLGSGFNSAASYTAGMSNIATLEAEGIDRPGPDVEKHFTIYVEGIGTVDRRSDVGIGMALGTGWTGVVAKVERGITAAISNIRTAAGSRRRIQHIHLDTFGFSRGAAAARHCIWKCLQEAGRTLRDRLSMDGFTTDQVVVKFVGLYDTVASYGVNHSNDTAELHLDAISVAAKVVQLAAAEEHRANFRLTNIRSAGGNGREIFLPGVHSDVGGGYATTENEVDWELFDLDVAWVGAAEEAALRRERDWLVRSGWYLASELQPTNFWNEIKATRRGISNVYARIPLRIMAAFGRENGVHFAAALESRHPIPAALSTAHAAIQTYVGRGGESSPGDWFRTSPALDPPWHIALRHDYLHFSSRYGGVGAHSPQWSGNDPVRGHRLRIIQNG